VEAVTKDISSRKDEIQEELRSIFEKNLKITDWNIPEADDLQAAKALVLILEEELQNIKKDVDAGKYNNF
jgi:hypothetical protein